MSIFETAVAPHVPMLRSVAMRLTRHNHADAEDLVQDALLRAFEAWDRYDTARPVAPWLYVILVRHFCNRHQASKASNRATEQFRAEAATSVDRLVAWIEYRDACSGLEEALSDEQRAVVTRSATGRSQQEIAEELGLPVGTVQSRLHRGRQRLAAFVGGSR